MMLMGTVSANLMGYDGSESYWPAMMVMLTSSANALNRCYDGDAAKSVRMLFGYDCDAARQWECLRPLL
jgi:hypothetical protein